MPRFTVEDIKRIYEGQHRPWKVGEEYSASRQAAYVEEMVKQQREREKYREKIPPSDTQCASTQAIIERDEETDVEHFLRPLPDNWKTWEGDDFNALSAEEKDKAVGMRKVTAEEVMHEESVRRRAKNQINNDDRTSVTPQKKEAAVHAMTYSKGKKAYELTDREREVLMAISGYEPPSPPIEELPIELTWWDKIKNAFGSDAKAEATETASVNNLEFYEKLRRLK